MPLFHTGGCVCCVIGAVSKAATQVLIEAFDPAIVLEMFGTYRGNAMVGVPTMLIAMLEHPAFPTTDLSVGQGDLFGRLDGAGAAGAAAGGKARRALHHRVRPDRVLAGGGADRRQRQRRGQGRHDRPAAAEHGNQDHRSQHRRNGADRHHRRVLHPRLSRHARLFRDARCDGRRDRRRRLAAHRRSLRDGCARLSARSRAA